MGIQAIQLPNGATFTISDWGDYPLWSRAELLATQAQDAIIFNYVEAQPTPGGGGGAAATKLDTNLEQASSLPLDHQMVIFSAQIRLDEANNGALGVLTPETTAIAGAAKWQSVLANTLFEFTVSNTHPFLSGPISEFPSGGGLHFVQAGRIAAGAADTYVINNGFPSAESARALNLPVHIGPLQTFKGKFSWERGALPNSATNFGLTCFLYGPRQRPVG